MTRRPGERVEFLGSRGELLTGRLDRPAGPPSAYAVFAHCFTCSKDIFAAGRIAAELNAHGIAVLRFDFTGLGSSDGDFANTNFSSNVEDLVCAADWLGEHHTAPQILIGHSLGGAAVLAAAPLLPGIAAVVTIGAPADTTHLRHLFQDQLAAIEGAEDASVEIAGRTFPIRRQLLDDLAQHRVLEHVSGLGAALLVMHSPVDNVVGIDHAARIYQAARHPKSFVSLDGADHLLSSRADAEYAARIIAVWADRFVTAEHGARPVPTSPAQVVVAETGQGLYLNHVVAGAHQMLADEPTSVGGFDAGPSPYDFLAAALGGCTSMTIRMYAQRKEIALDRVIVEVDHRKVHLDESAQVVDGHAARIDVFERHIRLEGELSDVDRQRLLAIADRCPVHRTLEAGAVITTTTI
jgi:uncharacterized OsmC-like protein/alpha-beta hydrolase superfamily lysophospholipase